MSPPEDGHETDADGYDPETGRYRTRIVWEGPDPIASAVVAAVSAITGTEPTEMTQLSSVVDTDALEQLFGPTADGTPRNPNGCVRFTFEGCEVTIRSAGELAVEPRTTDRPDG